MPTRSWLRPSDRRLRYAPEHPEAGRGTPPPRPSPYPGPGGRTCAGSPWPGRPGGLHPGPGAWRPAPGARYPWLSPAGARGRRSPGS
ncbi:hypothetical protein DTB58_19130 [Streptomyces griseus]|nr:hypothetical protein [Streptomyces griseus]